MDAVASPPIGRLESSQSSRFSFRSLLRMGKRVVLVVILFDVVFGTASSVWMVKSAMESRHGLETLLASFSKRASPLPLPQARQGLVPGTYRADFASNRYFASQFQIELLPDHQFVLVTHDFMAESPFPVVRHGRYEERRGSLCLVDDGRADLMCADLMPDSDGGLVVVTALGPIALDRMRKLEIAR